MRSVEAEGLTIDDAITRALEALAALRSQVRIDILEGEHSGWLGFGRRKARVRATMRPSLQTLLGMNALPAPAEPARSERVTSKIAERQPGEAAVDVRDAAEILRAILGRMDVDAVVSERNDLQARSEAGAEGAEAADGQRSRVLEVQGPGAALLIARRGEVLEALEYLVNRILDQGGQDDTRVVLDADGHRARRRSALEDSARRMAERARHRRKVVTFEPLGPADRRIVYDVLNRERGVAARSVGQGFYRRMLIIPDGMRRGGGKIAE